MRLLQITASKVWRGHEQKIIYLYEAFKEHNYVSEQFIICPNSSPVHDIATQKNMNVSGFDINGEYDLTFAKQLAQFVKANKIDVVFIHNSKSHTLAVISHLLYNLDAPLVLCRTLIKRVDTNILRKWKYNYKGIKKIICVSHPVVDALKFAVKDHSKLCVVGSVTDVNKFTKT
ncbi:MAG: glycosyltransferase, partial [Flavobacteriaceae bacterium]